MAVNLDFEDLVNRFYQPLYKFALSLTGGEADACDLTQQTFYVGEKKIGQLRDPAKIKTWLFTTMHRQFLNWQRHHTRFPHFTLETVEEQLPAAPKPYSDPDAGAVLEALTKVGDPFQAPLALFYLEDYSYSEIAEILGIPVGTVKSRLARGISRLQQLLLGPADGILALERRDHE
jgi:RNA polymerase sigma-70 factor, ECF subfamily